MNTSSKSMIALILTSAPLWGAVGVIGGAAIGYYQGENKDSATLVIELTRSLTSVDEKTKTVDMLISRGLLKGVSPNDLGNILEKNAISNNANVPSGLVCTSIWCSLRGQIKNIKKVYKALGIYNGPIDENADADFSNATIKYQQLKSLPTDGIVGAQTFALIEQDAARNSLVLQ